MCIRDSCYTAYVRVGSECSLTHNYDATDLLCCRRYNFHTQPSKTKQRYYLTNFKLFKLRKYSLNERDREERYTRLCVPYNYYKSCR